MGTVRSYDVRRTTAARICLPLLFVMLFMSAIPASATEVFARATGRPCAYCHLNPGGGGELTAGGVTYAATLHPAASPSGAGLAVKGFRLLVGYLHIMTAFLWFGTILYVHLVLKPAYASQGLPRGEVRVGLGSMAVMGLSGAILTAYRVTSLDLLLHSSFGILLLIKIGLYLVMVGSALVVVLVIGPRLRKRQPAAPPVTGGNLTLVELAHFDGQEGRPAYFAYQNRIYDATASRLWKEGRHMGRHGAATDLTEALQQAPHGEDRVLALPLVGELVTTAPQARPLHERVFYVMAYLNLTIVFAIVLILALWRWG